MKDKNDWICLNCVKNIHPHSQINQPTSQPIYTQKKKSLLFYRLITFSNFIFSGNLNLINLTLEINICLIATFICCCFIKKVIKIDEVKRWKSKMNVMLSAQNDIYLLHCRTERLKFILILIVNLFCRFFFFIKYKHDVKENFKKNVYRQYD